MFVRQHVILTSCKGCHFDQAKINSADIEHTHSIARIQMRMQQCHPLSEWPLPWKAENLGASCLAGSLGGAGACKYTIDYFSRHAHYFSGAIKRACTSIQAASQHGQCIPDRVLGCYFWQSSLLQPQAEVTWWLLERSQLQTAACCSYAIAIQ